MIERRRFFGGLMASIAGLSGAARAKAEASGADTSGRWRLKAGSPTINRANKECGYPPVPCGDGPRLLPHPDRIRAERDRLMEALLDPATPPDRWLQCYAARQALSWAIDPEMALSPCKTIAEGRVQPSMSRHSIRPSPRDVPRP